MQLISNMCAELICTCRVPLPYRQSERVAVSSHELVIILKVNLDLSKTTDSDVRKMHMQRQTLKPKSFRHALSFLFSPVHPCVTSHGRESQGYWWPWPGTGEKELFKFLILLSEKKCNWNGWSFEPGSKAWAQASLVPCLQYVSNLRGSFQLSAFPFHPCYSFIIKTDKLIF